MSDRVPFLDVGASYRELATEVDAAMARAVGSGWYLLGDELAEFEAAFARAEGAEHCVGVASGLDALVLTLRAFGIGPGDEVIVPAHTFVATWLAVSATGATPVPVDVADDIPCVAADDVARAVTSRTAAIMPVHLHGTPADTDALRGVADRAGVPLVVDSAQAHGATLRGRPSAAAAHAACWSFYPGKNLGALGDAGAVTSDDSELIERVRRLGNYGSTAKYVHTERGVNSRLDEVQAAVLAVKLRHLSDWNLRRAATAERYFAGIRHAAVRLPSIPPEASSSWHLFVVRTEQRDRLQEHLGDRGVETGIHYPIPPHHQGAYVDEFGGLSFPHAERWCSTSLSLPIGPHLGTADAERVIDAVNTFTPDTE